MKITLFNHDTHERKAIIGATELCIGTTARHIEKFIGVEKDANEYICVVEPIGGGVVATTYYPRKTYGVERVEE